MLTEAIVAGGPFLDRQICLVLSPEVRALLRIAVRIGVLRRRFWQNEVSDLAFQRAEEENEDRDGPQGNGAKMAQESGAALGEKGG